MTSFRSASHDDLYVYLMDQHCLDKVMSWERASSPAGSALFSCGAQSERRALSVACTDGEQVMTKSGCVSGETLLRDARCVFLAP